jgi:hypothetical protein
MSNNDSLSFERRFSNQENVVITPLEPNNKKILVQFNEKGKYQIELIAKDSFGKE